MAKIRKSEIEQFDLIRLLKPVELYEVSDNIKHSFPAGSVGVVLDIYDAGAAFEAEFAFFPAPEKN